MLQNQNTIVLLSSDLLSASHSLISFHGIKEGKRRNFGSHNKQLALFSFFSIQKHLREREGRCEGEVMGDALL